MINFQKAVYLTSAVAISQLPPDEGVEVAFIGRSNSGKSSALNTITGIKSLARTSSTPGRTQMINLFSLSDDCRMVDLPGYGYAKAPKPVQQRWEKVTHEYLESRQSLRGLVLIMDVRHPLKEQDLQMIHWATSCNLSLHIILSKADKLKKAAKKSCLLKVQKEFQQHPGISVQLFSSLDREGVEQAREQLSKWYECDG